MALNKTLLVDPKTKKFYLENQPIPELKSTEALIAIHFTGICGTDLHLWHDGHVGDTVVDKPHILGHESGGIVVKVGRDVKNVKPGDRVCLEPAVPCWKCFPCKDGRYNHCLSVETQSIPPTQGHLREFFVHPADLLYKLPENVSLQEGALIEPYACAMWACKRANVGLGKKILIIGSGSIGLLCLLHAKAVAASTVVVIDVRASRLEVAKQCGADTTILSDTKDPAVLAKRAIEAFGTNPDITLDCSGTEIAVQTGILATRFGGTVEIVGLPPGKANIDILQIVLSELNVIGSLRFVHCFDEAIEMVSSGRINLKPLMTHKFKLEDADKAFQTALTGADNAVKVMLTPTV